MPAPLAVRVAPEIFARHPDYVAAMLVADGVRSGPTDATSERALAEAEDRRPPRRSPHACCAASRCRA